MLKGVASFCLIYTSLSKQTIRRNNLPPPFSPRTPHNPN